MIKPARKNERGLYERPDGSWQICVSDGRRPDGSRRRIYKTCATKSEAKRELAKMLAAKYEGKLVERSGATIAAFLDDYLDHHSDVAPRTLERWRSLARLQINPHIGGIRLQNLKPSHLMQLYAALAKEHKDGEKTKRGLAAATIRQVHAVIHLVLAYAVTDGILSSNPASAIPRARKPRVSRYEVTPPDATAIATLLDALRGTPLYTLVLLASLTGMRRGELLALRWANVDLEHKRLTLCESLGEADGATYVKKPKSGKVRTIVLDDTLCEALEAHRREQARMRLNTLVFPSPEDRVTHDRDGTTTIVRAGSRWLPSVVSGKFKRAARRAGTPMRFHDLRHACASMMVAAGAHPKAVSDRLGHSGIAITMNLYSHLMDRQREEAAVMLGNMLRRAQAKRTS